MKKIIPVLNYYLLLSVSLPLLPVLYLQGRKVKREVPALPEAEGCSGAAGGYKRKTKVLLIGESAFAGVGVQDNRTGIAGRFAAHLSQSEKTTVEWHLMARNGYTISDINENFMTALPDESYQYILIGIGANDTFSLTPPAKWAGGLRAAISILQNRYSDSVIIFANMPPVYDFPAFTRLMRMFMGRLIKNLSDILKQICDNYDKVYYDHKFLYCKEWIADSEENLTVHDFFSDGVHPSEMTYDLWAHELVRFIKEIE